MVKKVTFKQRAKRTNLKERHQVAAKLRKRMQTTRRSYNRYDQFENNSRPMEEMVADIAQGVSVAMPDSNLDARSLTDLLLVPNPQPVPAVRLNEPRPQNRDELKQQQEKIKKKLRAMKETDDPLMAARAALLEREEQRLLEERRAQEERGHQQGGVNKNQYRHHGQSYVFWERIGLHPRLLRALRELHFTHPTPVQEEVLPAVLLPEDAAAADAAPESEAAAGTATEEAKRKKRKKKTKLVEVTPKDIVVSAETGSGKTLVFAIPILQQLFEKLYGGEAEEPATAGGRKGKRSRETIEKEEAETTEGEGEDKPVAPTATKLSRKDFNARCMFALVLSPTRELALQIKEAFTQLTQFAPEVTVGCIVGGMASEKQQRILNRHPHVLICTPGRLWELVQKNEGCYLGHSISRRLRYVVLDEADKMLQSGRFEELRQLLERIHCEVLPAGFVQEREEGAETGDLPIHEGRWDPVKQKFVAFTKEELEARAAEQEKGKKESEQAKGAVGEDDDEADEGAELGEKKRKDEPRPIPMPPAPEADHHVTTYVTSATLSLQTNYQRRDFKASKKIIRTTNADVMGQVLQQLEIKPSNARIFEMQPQSGVVAKINEMYLRCPDKSKDLYLYYFLRTYKDERSVIFVNAISMLRRLVKIIDHLGIPVVGLHAAMQQRQRLKFMDKFKKGTIRCLVATDVASRGLDIEGLKYVVHFQIPRTTDAYIHRCGRTARCGGTGVSLSLVSAEEHVSFRKLMESLGRKESDLETFAIQPSIVHQLNSHLRLVLQIDKLQREIDKSTASNRWVTRMQKEAELDTDDMVDPEAMAENREKAKAIKALQRELHLLVQKFNGSYGGKGAFRTGAQALGAKLAEQKLMERAERQTFKMAAGGEPSSSASTAAAAAAAAKRKGADGKKEKAKGAKRTFAVPTKRVATVLDVVTGKATHDGTLVSKVPKKKAIVKKEKKPKS